MRYNAEILKAKIWKKKGIIIRKNHYLCKKVYRYEVIRYKTKPK